MNKFWSYYDRFEGFVLAASLIATVIIITLQVIFRYILNDSLIWSEELTRYIFIWQIWLGTSYGMRNDEHLRVAILYDHCKPKIRKAMKVFSNVILLAFCLFLVINGGKLTMTLFASNTLSTALRIPMYTVYAALPISSLLVVLRLITQTITVLKQPASALLPASPVEGGAIIMEMLVLFGTFIVLILLAVPIGYAIGIATLISLFFFTDIPLVLISQNAIAGVDSFPLMAIPFFMLAGNLMSRGGIARRLIDFANVCVGSLVGGLAMVTTATSMFFAAISGSAVATTSAVGSFMIPEMTKKNYDVGFSAALAAAAGTIGIIIPPSIPLVIYGVAVGASIGDLFKAALIPGIIMGVVLMIACYLISKKKGYTGTSEPFTIKRFWSSLTGAFWALLSPGIILGGIYSGVCTPTEAAVVAVLYSVFVGVFVYHELHWRDIYACLTESMHVNGITTFMIGLSMAFASYLTMAGIPQQITELLMGFTDNKILMFLLVNIFLLLVGSLIDPVPAIIILAPILLPIMSSFGMTPITFGVVLIVNLAIGYITPPYGVNLFVSMAVAKISMERMLKYILFLFLAMIVALLLITYIEPLTMFLVNL